MFFEDRGQTRKYCFVAMFPKGGQTRKHCFLAMFLEGGQTRKHFFIKLVGKITLVNNGNYTGAPSFLKEDKPGNIAYSWSERKFAYSFGNITIYSKQSLFCYWNTCISGPTRSILL